MNADQATALRAPFPPSAVGYLPKAGVQLAYVGHAAVTDRLLEVDPEWSWEPVAYADDGGPLIRRTEKDASLWIKLTVCGVTRFGVGSVAPNAFEIEKQLIGDAIRNSAMRFGVALDLWSKEDLHQEEPPPPVVLASRHDVDELKARIELLSLNDKLRFTDWKAGQGFPWPWPAAATSAMHDELDKIAGEAGALGSSSTEDGGPPGAPSGAVVSTAAVAPPTSEPHGYSLWPKEDLAEECKELGLPSSGNKERLVNELRAWDILNRPGMVESSERPF